MATEGLKFLQVQTESDQMYTFPHIGIATCDINQLHP